MKKLFHKFALLIFVSIFKLNWQQSAELGKIEDGIKFIIYSSFKDELQKLCPSVQGIFCSHCNHKSVEQICPIECRFCGGGGGGGFGGFRGFPLRQGSGIPVAGPIEARGIGTMLPQNLGGIKTSKQFKFDYLRCFEATMQFGEWNLWNVQSRNIFILFLLI
jgi:hypothetical protein